MSSSLLWRACALVVSVVAVLGSATTSDVGWVGYGNDPGGTRYSPVSLINRGNVSRLTVAWTFRTGALDRPTELNAKAAFENTTSSSPPAATGRWAPDRGTP